MAFWDFLRPLTQQAIEIDFYTRIIVFVLSAAMFAVSLLAFRKSKSRKLMFVSIAFFLFALKWAFKIADLFISPGEFFHRAAENLVELLILASLFIAIFKK
ncbi:MAG: hypothetical protein JW744_01300 [Candidatus Diapherotrites archaeon]|uniref:Uncharacterized protein n=1 Tax=Candidatus Iainarchaeum sp. TaxID=3101447 RepID=A0A939C659_9ARCH|nr:hypothetical protein [Candidatus Diapherotrites archaeon]